MSAVLGPVIALAALAAASAFAAPAEAVDGRAAASWIAILLLAVGVGLLVAELFAASGALGVFGLLFLGGGVLLLVDPGLRPPLAAVLPTLAVVAAGSTYLVVRALNTRRLRPLTGADGLASELGTAVTPIGREGGDVLIHGEHWRAVAPRPIPKGAQVKVQRVDGLTLFVEQEPSWTT